MENYFQKHKVMILLFILSFLIFIIFAIYTSRGAFADIPCEFFRDIVRLGSDGIFTVLTQAPYKTTRFFSYIFQRLIFYMFFPFFTTLPKLLGLYTFSLIVMPFIGLCLNYVIALRTKRFDIAILAFAFYSFFNIPYISWLPRESLMATMIQFGVLSYFLSKEKLNKFDILILIYLFLFLFESFENSAILGFILFISGIIYYKKNPIENKRKLYMGIIGLLISIYIITKTLWIFLTDSFFTIGYSGAQWIHYVKMLPGVTFKTCMIVSFIGILLCCGLMFLRRDLNKKDLCWGLPLLLLSLCTLYYITHFVPDPCAESNLFAYCLIVLPLIFIIMIVADYLNILKNKYFFSNLVLVACIIGILQFIWQINSSFYSLKYVNSIKNSLKISQKPIDIIHLEDNNSACVYDAAPCAAFRSIIFSQTYKIKTIMFPDPEHRDYTDKQLEYTYYDESSNILYIVDYPLKIKDKYWDLTNIAEEFKRLGMTTRY